MDRRGRRQSDIYSETARRLRRDLYSQKSAGTGGAENFGDQGRPAGPWILIDADATRNPGSGKTLQARPDRDILHIRAELLAPFGIFIPLGFFQSGGLQHEIFLSAW